MSTGTATTIGSDWDVIVRHEWGATAGIETSLSNALDELDDDGFSETLYDYIDLDAVMCVLDPTNVSHGASEVRFDYQDYEVRITNDGTIEARD